MSCASKFLYPRPAVMLGVNSDSLVGKGQHFCGHTPGWTYEENGAEMPK